MTAVAEGRVNEVGQARRRREDAHLITGQTQWTDNITLPGMLHLAIMRSPVAHATITSVDVSAARERPGVVAAFSGADLAGDWGPLPMAWTVSEDQKSPPHFPLAADKVRFAGDGVAVVAATSREAAVDALEAIEFEFETLPAVLDMEEATADGSALVYDDVPANRCFTWQESHGDYAAARGRAEVVLKRRFINQRLIPSAMEPRSVVVQPSPATGEYTMWSSTQVPHFVQIFISLTAGVPQSSLRVIAPDVGGGFGSKLDVYAEEAIGVVLAKKLGVPVKWTETRSENYQVTIHGRDLIQDAEIAAMRDGTVLGLKVDLIANMGAYLQLLTPCIPLLGRYMYPGIYKFEAHDLSCIGVFTNTTPTDAYRGAGRPEATFVIERIMDELAAELDMDPLELRRANWIQSDEFPSPPFVDSNTTPATTRRRRPGPPSCSVMTSSAANSGSAASATIRCKSASAFRPTPRCAVSRRRAGWAVKVTSREAGKPPPSAYYHSARSRSSLERPRTGRATRRPSRRSQPTHSGFRTTTSSSCTATLERRRSGWTPTAPGPSPSAASRSSRRARRSSRRPRRSRRISWRPTLVTSSSLLAGSR